MLPGCDVWFPAFRIPYFSTLLGGNTIRQSSLLLRKPRRGGKILCFLSFSGRFSAYFHAQGWPFFRFFLGRFRSSCWLKRLVFRCMLTNFLWLRTVEKKGRGESALLGASTKGGGWCASVVSHSAYLADIQHRLIIRRQLNLTESIYVGKIEGLFKRIRCVLGFFQKNQWYK